MYDAVLTKDSTGLMTATLADGTSATHPTDIGKLLEDIEPSLPDPATIFIKSSAAPYPFGAAVGSCYYFGTEFMARSLTKGERLLCGRQHCNETQQYYQ